MAKPVASAWGSKKKEATNSDQEDEDEDKDEDSRASQEPKSMADIVNEIATNEAAEAKPAETAAPASAAAPTPGAYIPPSLRARMAAEAAAKPAEAAKPAAAAPASSGAYVPPSMRNRAPESSGSSASYEIPTSSVNYRRPNKSQPNLNDCLEFPSLDAAGSDAAPAAQNDERYDTFHFY